MSSRIEYPSVTYVHLPKTGGKSIRQWMQTISGHQSISRSPPKNCTREEWVQVKHPDTNHIRKAYDIQDLGYVFTCVRNPYDRIVSGYKHLTYFSLIDKCSFKDFILNEIEFKAFMKPMSAFFCEDKIDYAIRFENMKEDFSVIQKKLNKNESLPIVGKQFINENSYKKILDSFPDSRKIIYDRYNSDFEMFGYKEEL